MIIKWTLLIVLLAFSPLSLAQTDPSSPNSSNDQSNTESIDDSAVIAISDPANGDTLEDAKDDWINYSPYNDYLVTNQLLMHNDFQIDFAHSAGNSRNITIGGEALNIISYLDWINSFEFGINYSQSTFQTTGPLSSSNRHIYIDEQVEWHSRYNAYVLASFDWHTDKPSGMNSFYSGNLGVGYFLIQNDNMVLRPEISYHLSHEDQVFFGIDQTIHSALASLRFDWTLTNSSTFSADADYIVQVNEPSNFRFNLDVSLNLTIYKNIYFEPSFTLRVDNEPVSGFKKYDTNTSGSIGITF